MNNWSSFPNKGDVDIFVYSAGDLNGSGVMARTVFNHTPDQIKAYIGKPEAYMKANPVIEHFNNFLEINAECIRFHMKIKKMFVVAARDFVGTSRRYFDDNGEEHIIIYSQDHPDHPPGDQNEVVRGEIIVGGWYFKVLGPNQTEATNFVINDYKGNIPKMVLNMAAPTQAKVFKNMTVDLQKMQENGEI